MASEKPIPVQRGGSRDSRGVDQETTVWHGREPATQLVKRYSMSSEEAKTGGGGQGLLLGVVFPCMANILGVLLFLRLPWIVGKAGILHGFCLVFICCTCTFVTTLSMAAVATNGRILGGGSYYLISRSLGPAVGAGVGLCFYMANSIGAAMYFMGTVEAWEIARPDNQILEAGDINNIRVTAFCILGVALVVVAGGVKFVAKLGTVFLFIVLGVIVCMYLGCLIGPGSDNTYSLDIVDSDGQTTKKQLEWSSPTSKYFSGNFGPAYDSTQLAFPKDKTEHNFISLMALWFPAVTGIMAGSNRSADLKDPAGDIPRGTLIAQGFTSIVYLSFVLLYGAVAPRASLLHDKFFAASAAWPMQEFVMYGVMASTIGAGLTSLVSGCRLLSAIAGDRTLPILSVFAARPGKEPRLALLASGVLCALAVAIGELNAVAPVLTMFFLMCYTCVNMSCAIMELVHDPNWRPRFRFYHWAVSLFGAILCVWMMFAISWFYAMIAIVFCSIIFVYATHNSHQVKWGDGWQGMKFQLARNILANMDLTTHTKNWRPQLLVITQATISESSSQKNDEDVVTLHDPELLNLASQLKGGRGITILGGVCTTKSHTDFFSDGGLFVAQEQRQRVLDGQEVIQRLMQKFSIEGFGRIVYTANFSAGLMSLVQIAGLGAFQPNCVVTAWPKDWQNEGQTGQDARAQLLRMIQVSVVFGKVMLIAKGDPFPELNARLTGNVDIWWIVADGSILLLLPHLLMKHHVWSRCHARLFAVADQVGDDPAQVKRELEMYVRDYRLNIEVHVKVVDPNIELDIQNQQAKEDKIASQARELEELRAKLAVAEGKAPIKPNDVVPEIRESPDAGGAGGSPREGVFALDDLISGTVDYPKNLIDLDEPAPQEPDVLGKTSDPRLAKAGQQGSARRVPLSTPSSIGKPSNGAAGGASDALGGGHSGMSGEVGVSKQTSKLRSTSESNRDVMFMHSGEQLSSAAPCSAGELILAKGLNRLIVQESKESELVISNLPDMPPGESALGYFQLVDEMTRGLKRCFLVRGTAGEVITAFT